jgi:hypoxanthine phosphoribosyltransferase
MQTEKLHIDFGTIVDCARYVSMQIKEHGFEPDAIIPIVRGGMVPSALISDLLKVKEIYPINCSRYNGIHLAVTPTIKPFNYSIQGKRVLLVDDILDSGETFKLCYQELKSKHPISVMTASMFVRDKSVKPNFWSNVAKESEWIVFPWELMEFEGVLK